MNDSKSTDTDSKEVIPMAITTARGEPDNFTYDNTILKIGADFWYTLIISFLLASACSAFNQLAFGRKPKKALPWIASCVCFGMVSVLAVCLLWDSNLHIAKVIAISITCGFGGESIISMLAKVGLSSFSLGREALRQQEKEITKEK